MQVLQQVVEELIQNITENGSATEESCQFLNVALSFWFQEMRDSPVVKRLVVVTHIIVLYTVVLNSELTRVLSF